MRNTIIIKTITGLDGSQLNDLFDVLQSTKGVYSVTLTGKTPRASEGEQLDLIEFIEREMFEARAVPQAAE